METKGKLTKESKMDTFEEVAKIWLETIRKMSFTFQEFIEDLNKKE